MKKLFSSESVTEGHPDKICDQISDAVLDTILKEDPNGKCCCETLTTTGLILVAGEITTKTYVDVPRIARETLKEIGYTNADYGIDCQSCSVITAIDEQSSDIAQGEDLGEGDYQEQGAGDQGMMFGYATDETPEFMPLTISLAHKLTKKLADVRKNKTLEYLRPDGKSQVTVEYEDDKPKRVDAVVIAAQHNPEVDLATLRQDIVEKVVKPVCGEYLDDETKFHINATGRFVVGGPHGDTGLTGRKIIVDTYGGVGAHGGGCFSGKGPNKQDRSGAYMARWVAKNVVAAGLAKRCELQVAYAIGYPQPVSLMVNTFGTGKVDDNKIEEAVKKVFDFSPSGIIKQLDLLKPIYKQTASYGHFGRDDLSLPWENTDKAEELKKTINN